MNFWALIMLALTFSCAQSGQPQSAVTDLEACGDCDESGPDVASPLASLLAGLAVQELPAPIGIPTAGYGQLKQPENPQSPFADTFAATRKTHTPPMVKVLALQQDGQILVIAKHDLIGIFGPFLDLVLERLKTRHGVDLAGHLLVSCTHTHSGPGRLADNVVANFANDTLFPEYLDLVLDAVSATIVEALSNLVEAEIAVGETENREAHKDRRCENPDLQDDRIMLLGVRKKGEDKPFALLINYAVHGTVLPWQAFTISTDAPGAIEVKMREALSEVGFGNPEVLFLQGSAGDSAPTFFDADPGFEDNPDIPDLWTSMEALGRSVAQSVTSVLPAMTWASEQLPFAVASARLYIDPEILGYKTDEFPYPHGAIYCGFGQSRCFASPDPAPDMTCLPMPEDPMVHQAELTVARIGPALFATIPGEPHTEVGISLRQAIEQKINDVKPFVLGYSQAYLGYIMREEDWRNGGYEPTLAIWGYRFADYLIEVHKALVAKMQDPALPFPYPTADPIPWKVPKYEPRQVEASTVEPTILSAPSFSVKAGATVTVTFFGGDPWLGSPNVTLEILSTDGFMPYEYVPGIPLTSVLPYISLELSVDPPYEQQKGLTPRSFLWTATIPTAREIMTPGFPLRGTFRVRIEGTYRPASQAGVQPFFFVSDPFTVE